MNKKLIRNNVTTISILIFLISFAFINYLKPEFMYNKDGSLRQFGLAYNNKTIISGWLEALILAILSYLSVRYYLDYNNIIV